jgi:hypothetical protein
MTRINRAYVKRLEDLILRLDATLTDPDPEQASQSLERDMPALRKEADLIRAARGARFELRRRRA